jgi:endoglucanase
MEVDRQTLTRRRFLAGTGMLGVGGAYAAYRTRTALWRAIARRVVAPPARVVGPISTSGSALVDRAGREVVLTGVNWFGMESDTFAPHGLWVRNWRDMLDQIAAAGFNTLRLPFSNSIFDAASQPNGIDLSQNADLQGLDPLQLLDRLVAGAGDRGLRVILVRQRPDTSSQSELWYTKAVPEDRWIADWVALARRYRGDPTVIGADLHNEPHGGATWGSGARDTDWRLAAERAGNAILADNPDWLIIVEGIQYYAGYWTWWGSNLMGAGQYPVRLIRPDKLVYSAHDYGPSVAPQYWFSDPYYPENLPAIWERYWAYLHSAGIAPVWVGEFGGPSVDVDDVDGMWQRALVAFLRDQRIGYAYWAWNADSADTGGLLESDWRTLDTGKTGLLATFQGPPLD